jgi:hypothetical protein
MNTKCFNMATCQLVEIPPSGSPQVRLHIHGRWRAWWHQQPFAGVDVGWITGVGQPTHATLIDNDEAVAFIEKPHTQRGMANYTSKGVNQTTSNWI